MFHFFAAVLVAMLFTAPGIAQTPAGLERRIAENLAAYAARALAPLTLQVTTDARRKASAMIGAEGGVVTLQTDTATFTLEIPEDALFFPANVSLTAVTRIEGLGPEAKGVLAVEIGPAGLPIAGPAMLKVQPKGDELGISKEFFPFGFSAGGRNAHYGFFGRDDDGTVSVAVAHFSGFGFGLGVAKSSALGQVKIQTQPPDPNKTAQKAAEISDSQNGLWEAVSKSLSGDTEVASGETLTEKIKNAIMGGATPGGTVNPGGTLGTSLGCGGIEAEITNVNIWRKTYNPKKAATPKPRIEEALLQKIIQCARPPIEACFDKGDPWPLAKFLKTVRSYVPDPEDLPGLARVVPWLELQFRNCARYDFYMKTDSNVSERTADMKIHHAVGLPVVLDLTKVSNGGTDVYVVKGKGEITAREFRCKVRGASCKSDDSNIDTEAEFQITFADLPFDGSGTGNPTTFKPLVTPPFAPMKGTVSAQGMAFPIELEMINSFWECNFARFKEKGGYRFDPWKTGTYPELYVYDPPRADKACGGRAKMSTKIGLRFRHTPTGFPQFSP